MRMVDVTGKEITVRTAVASGAVLTTTEAVAAIKTGAVAKGDVITTARLAGVMAVKKTPDLLPLCHPIAIGATEVEISFPAEDRIDIEVTVKTNDRTGVEMEALTAVSVAGLTIIDMIKSMDPAARIDRVQVETKTGGKTDDWHRPRP